MNPPFNMKVDSQLQFTQKLNKHATIEYHTLARDLQSLCSVKTIINAHKSNMLRDIEVLPSIESSVIETLEGEKVKEKKCRGMLCGRPDMIYNEHPAEIKSYNLRRLGGKPFNYKILGNYRQMFENAIYQAGLYAWIYETRYSFLVIALYEKENLIDAYIKEIHIYKVDLLSSPKEEEINKYCESLLKVKGTIMATI